MRSDYWTVDATWVSETLSWFYWKEAFRQSREMYILKSFLEVLFGPKSSDFEELPHSHRFVFNIKKPTIFLPSKFMAFRSSTYLLGFQSLWAGKFSILSLINLIHHLSPDIYIIHNSSSYQDVHYSNTPVNSNPPDPLFPSPYICTEPQSPSENWRVVRTNLWELHIANTNHVTMEAQHFICAWVRETIRGDV